MNEPSALWDEVLRAGKESVKSADGLRGLDNTNHFLGLAEAIKLHDAIDFREEGIISATTDVLTRKKLRSALTDENTAGSHELSTKTLYSEALRITLAAVP